MMKNAIERENFIIGGDFLKDGEYHLVVHVWLMNGNGEFLLTKRLPCCLHGARKQW